MANQPLIVTVTGPSGSGKTVLAHALKDHLFEPLVSTTTRAPRQGETDGVDYHFISRTQFGDDLAAGKFIENVEYNGVLYGVSVEEAERAFNMGRPAVLVAEPHGVEQIKMFAEGRGWNVMRVFVDNPEHILLGRLINRLLMDVASIPMEESRLSGLTPWTNRLREAPEGDVAAIRAVLVDVVDAFTSNPPLARAPDMDARIDAAASRLRSFQFEQTNWVTPARTIAGLYEIVTPRFDQEVQDAVVNQIISQAQSSIPDPPRTPRP